MMIRPVNVYNCIRIPIPNNTLCCIYKYIYNKSYTNYNLLSVNISKIAHQLNVYVCIIGKLKF